VTLKLQGVFAPVVSTFHAKTEALDVGAFTANIDSHLSNGLDGIVVCGSTGEAALLTEEERLELLEAARRATPTGKLVIMGCGAESTGLTEHRCREAQTVGADAVLVVAPHYYSNAMSGQALRTHYLRVADASPLPVLLYNIPKYMHFKLSPELVAGLATHENIIGIKDSSGDLELLASYLKAQSDSFTVITGNGGQLHPAMMAGARAGILAVALFGAAHSAAIYKAHVSGDFAGAAALQLRMNPLSMTIVGELGVPGVKAALDAVGLHGGVTRGPLLNLDATGVARVRELIATL
jgi:4-hydroxy-2-oxoglutarate aldolase